MPHFDAQELRPYLPQVMAIFGKTGKEVVMVVERSGSQRAPKLDTTLDHDHGKCRLHFLPAHGGHHLNPIEGFWQVMKDAIGAGRGLRDLPTLYQRTRHVLMAPQERPSMRSTDDTFRLELRRRCFCVCWLAIQHSELHAAKRFNERAVVLTPSEEHRLDKVHHRCLSAIRELARVRKLLQPATTFQVNIGTHQTNQIVA